MLVTLVVCAAVALTVLIVGRVVYRFMVFHAERLVQCPENCRPAGVRVDAWRAAGTGLGKPHLRLSACSRWPEREGCGQECLRQIEASPRDCEVRRILAGWYEGKRCASCGAPFREILWEYQKPALLTKAQTSLEWDQIPVDQLPDVLQDSKPICFSCHMAAGLVREHPELVVERPSPPTA